MSKKESELLEKINKILDKIEEELKEKEFIAKFSKRPIQI